MDVKFFGDMGFGLSTFPNTCHHFIAELLSEFTHRSHWGNRAEREAKYWMESPRRMR